LVKKTSLNFVLNDLLSIFERLFKSIGKHVEAGIALGLFSASSFAAFLGKSFLAVSNSCLLCFLLKCSGCFAIWVELLHHGFILQWVLLSLIMSTDFFLNVS
jgi:hypothetical protein